MTDYAAQIEKVATHYWGEPSKRSKTELRWGTNGSKSVCLQKGVWTDFESGKTGGLVALVKANEPATINGSIADVLQRKFGIAKNEQAKSCSTKHRTLVKCYDYRDASGSLVYQVERYENPKTFRQRRPDGKGGWLYNLNGVQPVLYNLPELLSRTAEPIYLVEGEKDADALMAEGVLATTNSGGAGKWDDTLTESLRGREVIILPDNDEPGLLRAQRLLKALTGVAKSVEAKDPSVFLEKGDVSDFLVSHRVDELSALPSLRPQKLFPVMTLAQLKAKPPIEWLVEGILPARGVGFLVGAGGSGKTFCALHICLAILNEEKLWGHNTTNRGDIYYLAHEGLYGLAQRTEAALMYHGLKDDGLIFGERGAKLTVDDDIELILADAPKLGLIVLDTMSKSVAGKDENSNSDMAEAVERASRLADGLGCFVLIIDHIGKEGSKKGPRGASAKPDNADTVLMLSTDKTSKSRPAKLRVTKQREGPDDKEFSFQLKECWGSLVVEETRPDMTAVDQILWFLRENGPTTYALLKEGVCHKPVTGICDTVVTDDAFRKALSRLKNKEIIEKQGDEYVLLP
ncbi:AAA family ATPase [Alphaproteobacteria bacterium LSUCC0226]